MRLLAAALPTLTALTALSACSDATDSDRSQVVEPDNQVVESPERQPRSVETSASSPRPEPRPLVVRGIDVSHHQGAITWDRVADDGISFAYLKATEGSTFTDPRLTANWAGAKRAGLEVGGYHYFTLCSPPEAQADHFVATLNALGADRRSLPPVVDLELIGNCDPPPERSAVLASATTFIERVEAATGRKVVVYFHPDFEAKYSLVDALDRRLWVRRVGPTPPPGEWWMWQRSDRTRVAGIATPVDLDVRRERP